MRAAYDCFMARYLLVEVDSNASASILQERLDKVEGVNTLAIFTKPSQMCQCPTRSKTSVLGAKFGWRLCPTCRMPKSGESQTLWNILDRRGTPAKHRQIALVVRWVWNEDRIQTMLSPRKWHGSD